MPPMDENDLKALLDMMDDRKRDELLIRIDMRLGTIEEKYKALENSCGDNRIKCQKGMNAKLADLLAKVNAALAQSSSVSTWKTKAVAFIGGFLFAVSWGITFWKMVSG